MTSQELADAIQNGLDQEWTERPFGETHLKTKRFSRVSIDRLDPNYDQPRDQDAWYSAVLKREILDTQGVFEPILVEPIQDGDEDIDYGTCRLLIVDGHRRYENTRRILDDLKNHESADLEKWQENYDRFAYLNVEIIEKPLTLVDRLRVWVFIHRDRREWKLSEKERTAYRLIELVGQTRSAETLGVTIKELSKLVSIAEEAKALENSLEDKGSQITWAREIMNVREKFRTGVVMEELRAKIRKGLVVNSKDVRSLRDIVPNPQAYQKFMDPTATISEAREVAGAPDPVRATRSPKANGATSYGEGIAVDIKKFSDSLAGYSWEDLAGHSSDPDFAAAVKEARDKLALLEKAISSSEPTE